MHRPTMGRGREREECKDESTMEGLCAEKHELSLEIELLPSYDDGMLEPGILRRKCLHDRLMPLSMTLSIAKSHQTRLVIRGHV